MGGSSELVLEEIRRAGAATAPKIAEQVKRSRSQVAALLNELERRGVVTSRNARQSRGRPVKEYSLASAAGYAIAVDIGPTWMRACVADSQHRWLGEARHQREEDQPNDLRGTLATAACLVKDAWQKAKADGDVQLADVRGVGVAIAAPIDRRTKTVRSIAALSSSDGDPATTDGWPRFRLPSVMRELLEQELKLKGADLKGVDLEVYVDNDANLSALGEVRQNFGYDEDLVLFVKVSKGVGAGLVFKGKLYRGARGAVGEIGHLVVCGAKNEQGKPCPYCKRKDCLMALGSADAIASSIAFSLSSRDQLTINEVIKKSQIADGGVFRAAIRGAGHHLGLAIAQMADLVDPSAVIVGGVVSQAHEELLTNIRTELRSRTKGDRGEIEVVAVEDHKKSALLGAIELVFDEAKEASSR